MPGGEKLAINGGPKAVPAPMKGRFHFGREEKEAAMRLFDACIESGNAIPYNGPEEEAFGREFAAFMGGGFADGVNSGTNAVFTALRALELRPFSEVVVSAITDPGGIMPIALCSCIPVVADTEPGKYNTGPEQIESRITPQTSAIVVPHIGGEPADIKGIMEVANRHGLPVVEDCSQSHAATVDGRCVGTFGTYGTFSTMFGKHFCSGGQGGLVFSKTEDLYWRARRAADRGKPFAIDNPTGNVLPTLNCNMDELGAAIGRAQLKKLPSIVAGRRAFVARLMERGLAELKAVAVPEVPAGYGCTYWWMRLGIRLEALNCTRAEYFDALRAEGVACNPATRRRVPISGRGSATAPAATPGTTRFARATPAATSRAPTPTAQRTKTSTSSSTKAGATRRRT